jgi:uncharacterized protein YbaR (Trm112 family)
MSGEWRKIGLGALDYDVVECDAIRIVCPCQTRPPRKSFCLGVDEAGEPGENSEATCRACGRVYRMTVKIEVREPEGGDGAS